MRISVLFVFFFLALSVAPPAFAAPPEMTAEDAQKNPPKNPVEALKGSLRKTQAPAKTAGGSVPVTWVDMPRIEREKIVRDWENMPETTRPPFPVYRDGILDKSFKTSTDEESPALDGDSEE